MSEPSSSNDVDGLSCPRALDLRHALELINRAGRGLALVVDDAGRLVGTLTDGDVRRHLLDGGSLEDPVSAVYNDKPLIAREGYDPAELRAAMRARGVRFVPLLEDGRPVELLALDELIVGLGDDRPAVLGGRPFFTEPVPVARPTLPPYEEIEPDLRRALESGMITNDAQVRSFEAEAAAYLGVEAERVVALANCTTGLILALRTVESPGEVVMPSFTYFATGLSAVWNGLTPVFCEARSGDFTLDAAAAEAAVGPETRALTAVYTFGCPPPVDELRRIADEAGIPLILDAAHAFGTRLGERPAGTLGDIEVFSLSPTKPVTAAEGGLVVCRRRETAERLRLERNLGVLDSAVDPSRGLNGRLSELNAAVGRATLRHHEDNLARRHELVRFYKAGLGGLPGLTFQELAPDCRTTYKDFAVVVDERAFGLSRDELARALAADNVAVKRYFSPPQHLQRRFEGVARSAGPLTRTEELARDVICLPLWSHMERETVEGVVGAVARLHRARDEIRRRLETLGRELG